MSKQVSITVSVPDEYNWVAQQPFGTWTAFKEAPTIAHEEEDGFPVEYWANQIDELDLGYDAGDVENWKDTLRHI